MNIYIALRILAVIKELEHACVEIPLLKIMADAIGIGYYFKNKKTKAAA